MEVENQPRKTVLANVAIRTYNPSISEPEAEDSEASLDYTVRYCLPAPPKHLFALYEA